MPTSAPSLLALLLALLALGTPPSLAQRPDALVGSWVYRDMFRTLRISFLPDGRYWLQTAIGETTLDASGRYQFAGTRLTLSPPDADPITYTVSLAGTKLTLSGGDAESPMAFEKEPGSEQKLLALAREADAAKAQEDARWRARLPVARLQQPPPPHVAVGEVPADPRKAHVFKDPMVFRDQNLYLRLTPYTLRFAGGATADVFNSTKWYFLPTGRVFIKMEQYHEGQRYDPTNPQGDVKTFWGAYRVETSGEGERVVVETDEGEKIEMRLEDGRRNLYWGKEVYGQVDWENEALRRQGQPE